MGKRGGSEHSTRTGRGAHRREGEIALGGGAAAAEDEQRVAGDVLVEVRVGEGGRAEETAMRRGRWWWWAFGILRQERDEAEEALGRRRWRTCGGQHQRRQGRGRRGWGGGGRGGGDAG